MLILASKQFIHIIKTYQNKERVVSQTSLHIKPFHVVL